MSAAIQLTPATTATLIRRVLKKAFPSTRFSVTTNRGSMVSAVSVRWVDGPVGQQVDALTRCFTAGSFDGMTDSFDYNRGGDRYLVVDGIMYERGCRYVFTSRRNSQSLVSA